MVSFEIDIKSDILKYKRLFLQLTCNQNMSYIVNLMYNHVLINQCNEYIL